MARTDADSGCSDSLEIDPVAAIEPPEKSCDTEPIRVATATRQLPCQRYWGGLVRASALTGSARVTSQQMTSMIADPISENVKPPSW